MATGHLPSAAIPSVRAAHIAMGITGKTMFVPNDKLRQERERLASLWLDGEAIGVIAQEIKISKDAVKKRRRRLGLPARVNA